MKDTFSAGAAHLVLLAILALGVAVFAVLDGGRAHAGQERELTHLAGKTSK